MDRLETIPGLASQNTDSGNIQRLESETAPCPVPVKAMSVRLMSCLIESSRARSRLERDLGGDVIERYSQRLPR